MGLDAAVPGEEGVGAAGVLPRVVADHKRVVLGAGLPHLGSVVVEGGEEEQLVALGREVRDSVVLVHDAGGGGEPGADEGGEVNVADARLAEGEEGDVAALEGEGEVEGAEAGDGAAQRVTGHPDGGVGVVREHAERGIDDAWPHVDPVVVEAAVDAARLQLLAVAVENWVLGL